MGPPDVRRVAGLPQQASDAPPRTVWGCNLVSVNVRKMRKLYHWLIAESHEVNRVVMERTIRALICIGV